MRLVLFPLWALASSASAVFLATTTRYYDGQEGACGCGTSSGLDSWQTGISPKVYTAAGSQALFDTDGSSWCGAGCGKCYNLTSTGSSACNGCGTGGVAGESIIVMVTNLCPYNGNQQWCPQPGATNEYGYNYHFDIMAQSEVFGDNVVVQFEETACPGQATTDWETCVCYGQTDTDTTTLVSASTASSADVAAPSTSSSTAATSTAAVETTTAVAESSSTPPLSSATSTLFTTKTSACSGPVQTLYGQCGGANWAGATSCASGSTCKIQNPYYSQCLSD
ncbi:RlpA-like double-psi beta-barrel-protein domain-containing protein-containing protein [Talaromyces proteolyticus]|uniref:Cellulase n=1 Tax=Talaromyces proteolyticus TaxID=1131652 RepID=A0AAD4KE93_9EURO|nr:RlpA-like double-psi beta-barrel-protein domain-containing protein-containing protein [Talaromyces proteolyticus]KAH8688980.1 RlpA-like double-psi beta-barrel-protein domain-containing protein-containing protein [Talaromyces proteolyticus]